MKDRLKVLFLSLNARGFFFFLLLSVEGRSTEQEEEGPHSERGKERPSVGQETRAHAARGSKLERTRFKGA